MNSMILSENLRKRYAMNYFNENYFIAVYSSDDEYIYSFETLEEVSKYFSIPVCEILRKLRQNTFINYNGNLLKLFLVRKEKESVIKKR